MTNRFQNRLVGIIILIVTGIAILPIFLNDKKKYYQEKLIIVPLIPITYSNDDSIKNNLPVNQQPLTQSIKNLGMLTKQYNCTINNDQFMVAKLKDKLISKTENKSMFGLQTSRISKEEIPKQLKLLNSNDQILKINTWVVQLGALKNANKVTEIVDKLRFFGYHVYTVPTLPVQGQITRIFIGPDTSKYKLQNILIDLNQLSGLSGQLQPYKMCVE